jgi:hypothetical protein
MPLARRLKLFPTACVLFVHSFAARRRVAGDLIQKASRRPEYSGRT